MTKYTATCPECGQRWHCWAEREPCPCPECTARSYDWCSHDHPATALGLFVEIGTLTFEEEPENISK